jgi:hypothetical protein
MMHSLYRYYSASDVLLYVGISRDPFGRFGQHQLSDKDMAEVRRVNVDWFKDKKSAQVAELEQIKTLNPLWNILARNDLAVAPEEMTPEELAADAKLVESIFDNLDVEKFKRASARMGFDVQRDKLNYICGPRDGSRKPKANKEPKNG